MAGKAVPSSVPGASGPSDSSAAVGAHYAPAVQKPGGSPEPYTPKPYHQDPDENVKCPSCGKYNSPDARNCDQCGAIL